ncbi:SDR family oxidoreductase [Streptomyces sp. NPDC056948]|uniref:SDR family oxidoreductase n=1 Tax=Streptomyces sp. NPDC056948 TaxID=3345975 RepID=UPI0036442FDA
MSTAHQEGPAVDGSPVKDRTVVVTGAALAHALARKGARLALLDHDETALEATAAALPGAPPALRVDVTDGTALADAAEVLRRRLGPPSVVVANADIAEGGPFTQSDPATWQRVIDVNLVGIDRRRPHDERARTAPPKPAWKPSRRPAGCRWPRRQHGCGGPTPASVVVACGAEVAGGPLAVGGRRLRRRQRRRPFPEPPGCCRLR